MTRVALERRLARLVARDPLLRLVRDAARATGVPAWLVGGAIRDAALGTKARDVDLVAGPGALRLVRGLEAALARRAFRFRKRGVTTWRMSIDDRALDLVDAGRRGLTRDLLRRELTVNALAFGLDDGRLVDPARGLRDLRARRLVLPRKGVVREDPLRALRVARFLAALPDFSLARAALPEIRAAAPGLRRSSVERVREELDRLLRAGAPARGLEFLERQGLLPAVLPELLALRTCPAGEGRPDAWRHTLLALALAARPGRLPAGTLARDAESVGVLLWALLLHDIAKPRTRARGPGGRPTFHGHEVVGARDAERLLRRLRQPRAFRARVVRLVLFHLRPHHLADAGAPERGLARLVREAGDDLPLLVLHAACDARASGAPDGAARWRRLVPVLSALLRLHREARVRPLPRLVDGNDILRVLGIAPGPEVGKALAEIRDLQELGRLQTRAEALQHLTRTREAD